MKTVCPDDPAAFAEIVAACPVPVVALGGPKMADEDAVVAVARGVVDAGGAGIAFGRNVWVRRPGEARPAPARRRALVAEGASLAAGAASDREAGFPDRTCAGEQQTWSVRWHIVHCRHRLMVIWSDHGGRGSSRFQRGSSLSITRMNDAVLYVRDARRSMAFYRDVLGTRQVIEDDMTVCLPTGSGIVEPPRHRLLHRRRQVGPSEAGRAPSGSTTSPGRCRRWPSSRGCGSDSSRLGRWWGRATTRSTRASTRSTPTASSSRSCG